MQLLFRKDSQNDHSLILENITPSKYYLIKHNQTQFFPVKLGINPKWYGVN
jgi:hypothetical protein